MNARLMLAAAFVVAACGEKSADDAATVAADSAGAAAASMSELDHAVDIANGLSLHPTKGDSILAAHNLTEEQLETLMLKIARDSASSAEYGRRTSR